MWGTNVVRSNVQAKVMRFLAFGASEAGLPPHDLRLETCSGIHTPPYRMAECLLALSSDGDPNPFVGVHVFRPDMVMLVRRGVSY